MKCYSCKKPCEDVWMFGAYGLALPYKDREYCLECFTPIAQKILPQVEKDTQETDKQQIADSA